MMLNLSPGLFRVKIISSSHCVRVKVKVRGFPAAHKPNSSRPYYRKIRIVTPLMYYVSGVGIICHPSLVSSVEAALKSEGQL